ncbi:hypothetical protein C8R47DRAFT_1270699 [Mycena vitilis]|nr:hypothetical protein C8R47DRAFT_1270699 [Mycena vitilis]
MVDPLSIVQGAFELGIAIRESIEKVGENKGNLADLKKEVTVTVDELTRLARGYGDTVATEELKTALEDLMEQLGTIKLECQELAQSKGISAFLKAWLKRDKIQAKVKKLQENRTKCCNKFQLLSLARVEGATARTGDTTAQIEVKADQLITLARKEELQKWFQALDMRKKQNTTYALRHNDTGGWVLEGPEFAKWKEEPGSLWIRGISGTGKSVLSSITINHLIDYRPAKVVNSHTANPNSGIAYFYFDFRDERKQLVETMLRSIVMQLSEQTPTPYSVLDQHFKSCQGMKFSTYTDLLVMLDTILGQFTGTYIVLDALDECSEHDGLVRFISTLHGWGKRVHLLVASQPRTVFLDSTALNGASVIVLESKTTNADVLQFVNNKLELDSKLKHMKNTPGAGPKIVEKSNGMFRMAACLLQELARNKVDTDLDAILAELPNDLFGIYTRFLKPIGNGDLIHVGTLLRWLAFAARPITLLELKDALAINHHQSVFEPGKTGRAEVVCNLLEGLVTISPDTSGQVVTFAHSSVNDYIVSQQFSKKYKHDLTEAPSHTFLAQSCVTYLLHFDEHNPLNVNIFPWQYPLAMYAAKFWSHHLLRCHDRSVLQHSIMHLLVQGSQQYAVLNCVYDIDHPYSNGPKWSRHAPPPLVLCSKIGYTEGVRVLLDHCGADVNAEGKYGSALKTAAESGQLDIVRLLLEHGADVNAVSEGYSSALRAAGLSGNVGTVRLLLERGADVNAVSEGYGSALQAAAASGNVDTVRLLLEHDANVNTTGGEYGSALQTAVVQTAVVGGNVDSVRLLLEHGADVNATGGVFGSALQAAAQLGYMDTFRLLLDHGADVNTTGGQYGSALHAVAASGKLDIACVLLDHGANVNTAGEYHGTAVMTPKCLEPTPIGGWEIHHHEMMV